MKNVTLTLALTLATLMIAAPATHAAHYGPCSHEWVQDVPPYVVGGIKQDGVDGGVNRTRHVAHYCILQWVPVDATLAVALA